MGMSISASRASTAPVSQPIAPSPQLAPAPQLANNAISSVNDMATELLSLNSDGPLGRNVNLKA